MNDTLAFLPPPGDLESKKILKKAGNAHRYLAELKGRSSIIPNRDILIRSLMLQEAKDSSAIEDIVTTLDDVYRAGLHPESKAGSAAKEVQHYASALGIGFNAIQSRGLLTLNGILAIQEELERNRAGFRKLPGTALVNASTNEVVYTPPQDPEFIQRLMTNLERVINDDAFLDIDPLVKLAVIHYQFESIHPFYDGNGRTGRIINVLFLVQKGLLDIPILYLSRYFIRTRSEYYRLLQEVRLNNAWEEWILYVLEGIETTSRHTIRMVDEIHATMVTIRDSIRDNLKFYSMDLVDSLFRHPYTRIDYLVRDLGVSRLTAAKYLDALVSVDILAKEKAGRENVYINVGLIRCLSKEYGD